MMILANGLTEYERADDGSCDCHFLANGCDPAEHHHEFMPPVRVLRCFMVAKNVF